MVFKNPLEEQLRQWGKGKRQMPASALGMKEKVLNIVKTPQTTLSIPKSRRLYFGFLSGVAAIVLVFVSAEVLRQNYRDSMSVATIAGTGAPHYFSSCGGGECDLAASSVLGIGGSAGEEINIDYGSETGLGVSDIHMSHPIMAKVVDLVSQYQDGVGEIQDTREFLQYGYHAEIKTRKVEEVTGRLQTIVRGYGGRLDGISINQKFGSIYFVVPKSSLDAFKNEVKSLVNYRFYTESINANNLLSQKVEIEKSTDSANESLAATEQELALLNKNHNRATADWQKQLAVIANSINNLQRENTTSTARQQQIDKELNRLYSVQSNIQKQFSNENQQYKSQKFYIEGRIKDAQSQLSNLEKQDEELQNTVETVQGSIEVEWVSVFDVIKIYMPHFWTWIIGLCILVLIFNYYSKQRVINIENRD